MKRRDVYNDEMSEMDKNIGSHIWLSSFECFNNLRWRAIHHIWRGSNIMLPKTHADLGLLVFNQAVVNHRHWRVK